MQIIEKHYKITNWCDYEEVALIGSITGMLQDNPVTFTTKEGHLCTTKTWLGMCGDGWEIRTYQVSQ